MKLQMWYGWLCLVWRLENVETPVLAPQIHEIHESTV